MDEVGEEGEAPLPALRTLLNNEANRLRLVDLFNRWDQDQDGLVGRREFRQAIRALGNYSLHEINEVFNELDSSGAGKLTLQNCSKLRKLDRDLSPQRVASRQAAEKARQRDAKETRQELRAAKDSPRAEKVLRCLRAKMDRDSLRVVDVFRRMDASRSSPVLGVTKEHFREALKRELPKMASKKMCDAAFRSIELSKSQPDDDACVPDTKRIITFDMLKAALPPPSGIVGKRAEVAAARKERTAERRRAEAADDKALALEVFTRLRKRLDQRSLRVVDIFRRWAEGSNKISHEQMRKGLALDIDVVDRDMINAAFRTLDKDRSGLVTFDELCAALAELPWSPKQWPHQRSPRRAGKHANPPEPEAVSRVIEQLRAHAQTHGLRVVDLFNKFDTSRSGKVTSVEFGEGLASLGFDVEASAHRAAFAAMATIHSDSITLGELRDQLRVPGYGWPRPRTPSPSAREPTLPAHIRIPEEAASLMPEEAEEAASSVRKLSGSLSPVVKEECASATEAELLDVARPSLPPPPEWSGPVEPLPLDDEEEPRLKLFDRISSMQEAFSSLFGREDEDYDDESLQLSEWTSKEGSPAREAAVMDDNDASSGTVAPSVSPPPREAEELSSAEPSLSPSHDAKTPMHETYPKSAWQPQIALNEVEPLSWSSISSNGVLAATRVAAKQKGLASLRGHRYQHSRQCSVVDRRRDCIIANKVFDDGGVHRWCFTVQPARGGNSSMIRVGVAAADCTETVTAWGFRPHLQGKLFELDAQSGCDHRVIECLDVGLGKTVMSTNVMCEVDLARGCLSFAGSDGAFQVVSSVHLPSAVIPWCCLFHEGDAVTLSEYRRSTTQVGHVEMPEWSFPVAEPTGSAMTDAMSPAGAASWQRQQEECRPDTAAVGAYASELRDEVHPLLGRWRDLQATGRALTAHLGSERVELDHGPQLVSKRTLLLQHAQRDAERALQHLQKRMAANAQLELQGNLADRHAAKAAEVSLEAYLGHQSEC